MSSLGLQSSPGELLAEWLAVMAAAYPGYAPSPASPEYVDAQGFAAMFSDVAQVGVVVPSAIVRAFGTQLYGIPYLQGLPALASVQVTAVDTAGYVLPGGTDLTLGTTGFITQSDLTIANGSSVGTVVASAAQVGAAANGATNPTNLESTIGLNWVASVTALGPASGGADPESDTAYQNRLVSLLRLLAPRPITASDYATMALSFTPAAGTDQEDVGRATSIDGYLQGGAAFTVSMNSTTTLTVTTAPGTGITAAPGATITGTNIPSSTLVVSSTSSTIVMNKAATATTSGITATVGGTLGNERTVTTAIALADGTATNADTKTAVQAYLAGFREINFDVDVIDPTYTSVYVTASVHLYPGFDPTASGLAIQAAVMAFLSPVTFGLPAFGNTPQWLSGTTIYVSQLASVIQNAANGAVQYIVDGSLKLGMASTPSNLLDLTIPGPIALPQSSTSTVPVPTIV